MEEVREEYACSGKKYNGEKAIISLTSWRARINTVSKTLYSLLTRCPGFHIVLVLSEEEFPQKEKELPESLMLFVESNLIEILWFGKNIKSFKKILPTMQKYKDLPVISADDDCIYKCNYAQMLYNKWLTNKDCVITFKSVIHKNIKFQHGPSTLYCPNCFGNYSYKFLTDPIIKTNHDDVLYGILLKKFHINIIEISEKPPYMFHDCIQALSHNKVMTCQTAIDVITKELQ